MMNGSGSTWLGVVCLELAPSKNTENYKLASLLAKMLKVKAEAVEFIVGGKKRRPLVTGKH